MIKNASFAVLVFLLTTVSAFGQEIRHELGRRVIEFEKAFQKHIDDLEVRKRTVQSLNNAVQSFFSLNLPKAGQYLAEAKFALTQEKVSPAMSWAESLYLVPQTRLLEASPSELLVNLKSFYDSKQAVPEKSRLLLLSDGDRQEFDIVKIPSSFLVKLPKLKEPQIDQKIELQIQVDSKTLSTYQMAISRVEKLATRKASLDTFLTSRAKEAQVSVETKTLAYLNDLLTDLAKGETLETDYPAGRLILECEKLVESIRQGATYYNQSRPGEFWLSLPTQGNSAIVRIFVPANLNKDKPVPLVVAMHGAGGSENMFFDAYGAGCCMRECEKRGWMMIAPRGGFGASAIPEILETLSKRYPIDPRKIFVVGHSMGSAQAFSAVQSAPEKFAAIAGLGGAGSIRKPEVFQKMPVFIGVGDSDFALRGSKSLSALLIKNKAEKMIYKEYPAVEHLAVVQVAIKDVFQFLEAVGK
ncbi:hypothetical protein KIH39_14845 [Telmatocola sphagniphila]|uniref:AB hydrolase-1 domain-containing protein n=1 Tax=Telmatocola sphagniphila TaxID=1123043 RepID=A0A8E6B1N4_9BACT|nr:alpha/beta fold hydrolase [Telmatocola sphagniphila]QVL30132.1 hypothetical protein KIH39_14845 [Telmatocola sphagniphila]